MILDERTEIADSSDAVQGPIIGPGGATLTVTANTTTQIGDIIPLQVARDLGTGPRPLFLVVLAGTNIVSAATTTTLVFNLITGSATSGSPPTITTPAIVDSSVPRTIDTTTTLVPAGTVLWMVQLPPDVINAYSTFLGLSHTNGSGAALAAGCKIDAFLTSDVSRWKAIADATN